MAVAGGIAGWLGTRGAAPAPEAKALPNVVVPAPASVRPSPGVSFSLPRNASIATDVAGIGEYLAGILRTSTGFGILVKSGAGAAAIQLRLGGAPAKAGDQGYELNVTKSSVVIRANQPAGLFAGVQTLLQLLPPAIFAVKKSAGPWTVPGGVIVDYPRFAYRGAMLDVARHFFTVDQVKHYINEIAHYKINYLHLHLSDDQGWRLAVDGWPALTEIGGSTQVGGGQGGYYTQADYSAIVAYAASRYITIVPEIDMPGHTNAALASYPELNCDGIAPRLYTGTDVGFSSLCSSRSKTYEFIDAVVAQLAKLTPGPYIHIGGDEAQSTLDAEYVKFIERAQQIVTAHGKIVVGWHDITKAKLQPSTVAQYWGTSTSDRALATVAAAGTKVIMSPANRTYLDMKYNPATSLGKTWAGMIEVKQAYDWNPGAYLPGVGESAVLGVEAPLWTETIISSADIDYMTFPRLPAIAELGWSPWSTHNQDAFNQRLAAQAARWRIMGVNFYRSPQVTWQAKS